MNWHIDILTLFPEMFPGPLGHSIAGKALEEGKWSFETTNIRDFATDNHKTVDDKPFGGGAGMVMLPEVLSGAIESVQSKYEQKPRLIYMSPRGEVLSQAKSVELVQENNIAIICGRYEGIDQRVIDEYGIEEISVGDYILSGGEIAAITLIDTCIRQLSGVLGNPSGLTEESFSPGKYAGLLEYPHYTRPSSWRGREVPEVLTSGNHAEIDKWRLQQAEAITKERRQDLWKKYQG